MAFIARFQPPFHLQTALELQSVLKTANSVNGKFVKNSWYSKLIK